MIYGIIIVAMVLLSIAKGYAFTKITLRASSKLHDTMFKRVRQIIIRFTLPEFLVLAHIIHNLFDLKPHSMSTFFMIFPVFLL